MMKWNGMICTVVYQLDPIAPFGLYSRAILNNAGVVLNPESAPKYFVNWF